MALINISAAGENHPLSLPLISLVTGIIFAERLLFNSESTLLIFSSMLFILLLLIVPKKAEYLIAALILFPAGFLLTRSLSTPPDSIAILNEVSPVDVSGLVDSRVSIKEDRFSFTIQAEEIAGIKMKNQKPVRLNVTAIGEKNSLHIGDRVKFRSKLKEPRNLKLIGEYNLKRSFLLKGVYRTVVIQSGDIEVIEKNAGGNTLQRFFQLLSERFSRFIDNYSSGDAAGVLKAILIGERNSVPSEINRQYAYAGVNHILSVSGSHLGVLAFTLFTIVRLLSSCSSKMLLYFDISRFSTVAALPFILSYLLLTGNAPATFRSGMMFLVVIVYLLTERERSISDILAFCAITMLIADQSLLFDISFQLSFLAIWGIVVLTPLISKLLCFDRGGMFKPLLLLVAATIAATFSTFLPVIYFFHIFSLTGLISNLIIVPLMGYGVVITGLIGLVVGQISESFGGFLITSAAWVINLSDNIIRILSKVPVLKGVNAHLYELFFVILMLVLFTLLKNKKTALFVSGILAVSISVARTVEASFTDSRLKISFLSVGQAESAVVRLPDGKKMLVDTGGRLFGSSSQFAERTIIPSLYSMGIDKIDYLIITHPHPDHCGAVETLLEAVPISEVWITAESAYLFKSGKIKELVENKGIILKLVAVSNYWKDVGGADFKVLWPLPEASGNDVNDRSMVFMIGKSGRYALFTGDIGWEVADYLAEKYSRELKCSILKVPHHGSRHSSSPRFIKAANPENAVISAGYGNNFSLPSAEALCELHSAGIRVLRTDLDGTITFAFDGNSVYPIR